jgi:hypothetical protein
MITNPAILSAIDDVAPDLNAPSGVSRKAVLAAICGVETSWGHRMHAGLFEPAYYRGGRYFRAPHVMQAVAQFESLASCSFGPWQMLYIAAIEFGFTGTPCELIEPSTCAPLVVKYLNKRTSHPTKPTDYADAWNSGTNRDDYIPHGYLDKFTVCYQEAVAYYSTAPPPMATT